MQVLIQGEHELTADTPALFCIMSSGDVWFNWDRLRKAALAHEAGDKCDQNAIAKAVVLAFYKGVEAGKLR